MSEDSLRHSRAPQGAEKIMPYSKGESKTGEVEQMFDSIAPAYDFMNAAMTFGLHKYWRNRAIARLKKHNPGRILDVATGTGDVAFTLYSRLHPEKVTGVDLSAGMLDVARRKLDKMEAAARRSIDFIQGDCLALPFTDGAFDAVTVAYGVRNFERLSEGYAEMHRVLAPGGVLCVIELSEPRNSFLKALYRLYSRRLIPAIGKVVSGDSRAYSYLPESIAACPQRDDMTSLILQAGFADASWHSLTFGAVTLYIAHKA